MKRKINYIILLVLTLIPSIVSADELEYIACGNAKGIPAPVANITSICYTMLVVATPIILIIFSIVTLVKAITAGAQDDIMKAKNKLIKKFVAAGIVFLVASVVQFVVVRAADASENDSVVACIECLLYNSGCTPSDDGYTRTETEPSEVASEYSINLDEHA